MREIKFRAWDKSRNLMHSPGLITPFRIDLNGGIWCEEEYMCQADFVIMEFTGLEDGNGKEIYEGDIIQMDYKDYKAKVVFWERPPEFAFDPIDEDEWIEDWNIRQRLAVSLQRICGKYPNPHIEENGADTIEQIVLFMLLQRPLNPSFGKESHRNNK